MRKELQELLKDKQQMKAENVFTVDTEKVLSEVIKNKFEIVIFLYCEAGEPVLSMYSEYIGDAAERVKTSYIDRYASVKSHRGFLAIVQAPVQEVKDIKSKNTLVLLDNIQDPSNLGAIIRSGAAFGFTDYLLLNCAYIYNEKAIRASAGTVFMINFKETSVEELKALKSDFKIITTDVDAGSGYLEAKKTAKKIITLGNEGAGISDAIRELSDMSIKIDYPNKKVESLNVAAAAAVLFYVLAK